MTDIAEGRPRARARLEGLRVELLQSAEPLGPSALAEASRALLQALTPEVSWSRLDALLAEARQEREARLEAEVAALDQEMRDLVQRREALLQKRTR